jgi:hypothetical protein
LVGENIALAKGVRFVCPLLRLPIGAVAKIFLLMSLVAAGLIESARVANGDANS